MKVNKATRNNYIILFIILVISVGVVFWNFWQFNQAFDKARQEVNILSSGNGSTKTISEKRKSDLILKLKELKQYGFWPITEVRLSENRGDPFSPRPGR
ncbi:MAG: hypothetical protein AAB358_01175 [Patescibacteria group bacterium]